MLSLYFVRHGQTEWNEAKRIQGRKDSPLTTKGLRDAKHLSDHLTHIDWTAIYSSPSKRTVKTAKIIKANHPKRILLKEDLLEMHLGKSEGETMENIKEQDPEFYHHYWEDPANFHNETGENFYDVKKRVERFLIDIEKKYKSGNILVVTHGIVIKVLQLIINDLPMDELWNTSFIDGTSVTKIDIANGAYKTSLAGDLSHLT